MSDLAKFQRRSLLIRILRAIARRGWLFYLLGLVWLAVLPGKLSHKTNYPDENALLAGQVTRHFGRDGAGWISGNRAQVDAHWSAPDLSAHIHHQFQAHGLQAFTQVFTTVKNESRKNVYGAFHAPRADGTESILLSAPRKCPNGRDNRDGVTYLLTLVGFLKKFRFWAKDLMFVVADGTEGMEAWAAAYHLPMSEARKKATDPLQTHSGVIQQAINLEFCGDNDYSALGLKYVGTNGQLPNFDLLFVAIKIARMEGIRIILHDRAQTPPSWLKALDLDPVYNEAVANVATMVKLQGHGFPNGNHAVLPKFGIDSMTLVGVSDPALGYPIPAFQILGLMEETLRSLNNLLEHFHHSFFFYLLPNIFSYIPVSFYAPIVVCFVLALVSKSMSLWWGIERTEASTPLRYTSRAWPPGSTHRFVMQAGSTSFVDIVRPLAPSLVAFLVSHLFGISVLWAFAAPAFMASARYRWVLIGIVPAVQVALPILLHQFQKPARLAPSTPPDPPQSKIIMTPEGQLVRLVPPPANPTPSSLFSSPSTLPPARVGALELAPWEVTKSFACLWTGLVLLAIAAVNMSLAMWGGILLVPLYYLVSPVSPRGGLMTSLTGPARAAQFAVVLALLSPLGLWAAWAWIAGGSRTMHAPATPLIPDPALLGPGLADMVEWAVRGFTVHGTIFVGLLCCVTLPGSVLLLNLAIH